MAAPTNQKRPADDGYDPIHGKINLKPIPPYAANEEKLPHSVVQSKEWAVYQQYKDKIGQLLTEPLTKYGNDDQTTQTLLEMVQTGITTTDPGAITLCVTGPMGTGKSATLNSLFSVTELAREGDDGGSCTLSSCMFRGLKKGQMHPFVAEVEFFERQERREILTEYLTAYYYATNEDEEDEEDGPSAAQNNEDADDDQDIRNEVISTLVALFGKQVECRTKQTARDFLDAATSAHDITILGKLFSWCDNIIARATGEDRVVTISASSLEQLQADLTAYTSCSADEFGSPVVCLTPMVSLITFYFDNPLTRLGIVFLDTPGTSDHNRIRRRSANMYRQKRTHCAVLSDEARAKDDANIPKEIRSMGTRGGRKCVVVITRSDVIKDTTSPQGSKRDKETVQELRRAAQRFSKELNAIEIEESNAETDERLGQLAREKREIEMRVKLVQNADKAQRIIMRSASNRTVVEEKLADITPTSVPILSVSNSEYAKHLAGYLPKKTPVLSVEETNIPRLRSIISAFPNDARLNEVSHLQTVKLPTLLTRLRLYTAKSPADCKEDLEIIVRKPLEKYEKITSAVFKRLGCEIRENILDPIRNSEEGCNEESGELCKGWKSEFKASAFLNLMKRDGRRKGGKSARAVSLSADLIDVNCEKTNALFSSVLRLVRGCQKDIEEDLEHLVSNLIQELKEDPNASLVHLEPFYNAIAGERGHLRHCVKVSSDRLFDGCNEIHRKLTEDDEDAYLIEAMLPIYREIATYKTTKGVKKPPKGWPEYRHSTFKHRVTTLNGLWACVYEKVEAEVNQLFAREVARLNAHIGEVFQIIHDGFNRLCEVKDSDDPNEKEGLEKLKLNLQKAQELLEGPMQQQYDAMEKHFRGAGTATY